MLRREIPHDIGAEFGEGFLDWLGGDLTIVHASGVAGAVQRGVEVRYAEGKDRVRLVAAILADQQDPRRH